MTRPAKAVHASGEVPRWSSPSASPAIGRDSTGAKAMTWGILADTRGARERTPPRLAGRVQLATDPAAEARQLDPDGDAGTRIESLAPRALFWRHFKRDRLAIASLVFLGLL